MTGREEEEVEERKQTHKQEEVSKNESNRGDAERKARRVWKQRHG